MISLDMVIANVAAREQLRRMLDAPRGIVALNGGDGSGKTTALFALAHDLRLRKRHITVVLANPDLRRALFDVTGSDDWDVRLVRDDVEDLRSAIAAASPRGVVVVEELDYRNARMLVDAAKGGATLITQIHTPFIGIDTANTLAMMGIPTADFFATFSCIVTQILLPQLCKQCRAPVTIDSIEARKIDPTAIEPMAAWREIGCAACDGRGTKGRIAAQEVLMINDGSRQLLADYVEKGDLRNPLPPGHVTVQETARALVRQGDVGIGTYQREISQNPILRMQHHWELESRRAGRIREMFSRFVTSQVADRMLADAHVQEIIDGERRVVTCMFADIRGFTPLAEGLPPVHLFRLLNHYFKEIIRAVSEHGGTIDKFVGDCVMVIFSAPVDQDDHEYQAVRCAIDIQQCIATLNAQRTGEAPIQMGIGINSGEAITGCLGSAERMDYTALGDTVNTAARLEGRAKGGQILIGAETAKAVTGRIQCRHVGSLMLKGKLAGVEAFEVIQP